MRYFLILLLTGCSSVNVKQSCEQQTQTLDARHLIEMHKLKMEHCK